jgi:hypothetical protein
MYIRAGGSPEDIEALVEAHASALLALKIDTGSLEAEWVAWRTR